MATRKKAKRPARKTGKAAARPARKRVAPKKRPAAAGPATRFTDTMAAPRCRSRIPVEIEAAGRREQGAIADMSASGARIVGVRLDLPPGTPVAIRYGSGTAPILLSAELVRPTPDGFAVKILRR